MHTDYKSIFQKPIFKHNHKIILASLSSHLFVSLIIKTKTKKNRRSIFEE